MCYSTDAKRFYSQVKASGSGRDETNIQPYITVTARGTWIVSWTQTSEEVEPGQRPEQRAVCSRSTDEGRKFGAEIVIEKADDRDIARPPQLDYAGVATRGPDSLAHESGSPTVEPADLPDARAGLADGVQRARH